MMNIDEQIINFSNKCDDLLQAKFILAPSKISDLLRAVASAPALVSFLQKATSSFDYRKAQELYMRPSPDGTLNKGVLLLPDYPVERLAFIFCLLVDIDNQSINFNSFLQTFFAEDGSYTQAFDLFLSQVIRPFKNTVCEEFLPKPTIQQPTYPIKEKNKNAKRNKKAIFSDLSNILKEEMSRLANSSLAKEDIQAGSVLLNELFASAKTFDEKQMKTLLIGYHYFIAYTKTDNKNLLKMFHCIEEL